MIYESAADRKLQSEVVGLLAQAMPRHTLIETPEEGREHHDVVAWLRGKMAWVGEIKCRNYPLSFFRFNDWFMETKRLNTLWGMWESRGIPVLLVLYTSDKRVMWVRLRDLMGLKLKPVPAPMMRDNHGTQQATRAGAYIPKELLRVIKRRP